MADIVCMSNNTKQAPLPPNGTRVIERYEVVASIMKHTGYRPFAVETQTARFSSYADAHAFCLWIEDENVEYGTHKYPWASIRVLPDCYLSFEEMDARLADGRKLVLGGGK